MLGRLSFRVRTLLVVFLVAVPPLVAFGAFALVTSGQAAAAERTRAADDAVRRASDLLSRAVESGRSELTAALSAIRGGESASLMRAVASGDPAGVARLEEALAPRMPGWRVAVVDAADGPPERAGRAPATGSGALVRAGRLELVASVAVDGDDESGLVAVAWRDETDGLLEEMRIAAGGGIAIGAGDGGGGVVVAGASGARSSDLSAALSAPSAAAVETSSAGVAGAPLPLADGSVGRIAVAADPPPLGFASISLGPVLFVVGTLAVLWAVLLAMAFVRSLGGELRDLAEAAERVREGEFPERRSRPRSDELGRLAAVHHRLAASLDERNRQIAELASQVAGLPIGEDPAAVARGVARAAELVTRVPGWTVDVLRSSVAELLPAGRYAALPSDGPSNGPAALDNEPPESSAAAWATLIGDDGARRCGRFETAAGEVVAAHMPAGKGLEVILVAPWSGLRAPSPAELHLFALLGQHGGTAIEHAVLYARLRTQARELERLASIQGDFLRGITHDLQTPLTRIAALASELSARAATDREGLADLNAISEQAERLRRMVALLLVASRLDAGGLQPRQEVVRAAPLLRRTWEALHPPGRALAVDATGTPHLLIADADRLEQVLWALLDNAIKYSAPGAPVRAEVWSRPRTERDPALHAHGTPSELVGGISISDEGIGMDEAEVARCFEQFYRSETARRLVPDGSGIGLYAARGLVQAMGGTLSVSSRQGRGTTFRISLPAEAAQESPLATPVELATGKVG